MQERGSFGEENALEEIAIAKAWVRQNFSKALYMKYRDTTDGGHKYLEIDRERGRGFTSSQVIEVEQMARYIEEAVPDFQSKSREEVVEALKVLNEERHLYLESFLKRFRPRPKRT